MLAKLLDIISYIDWSELAKVVASIWIAIVATIALTTWRRQLKATQKTELLDKLITAVHTCKTQLLAPIWHLQVAKISFESHMTSGNEDKRQGAINYIKTESAKQDSKIFMESLISIKDKIAELEFLTIKIQMYDFIGFNECYKTNNLIIKMYESLETVAIFIGKPNYYWKNPEIIKRLDYILNTDPEEMKKILHTEYLNVLKFTKKNYKRI